MNQTDRVEILFRLGQILDKLSKKEDWSGFDLGINESEYKELEELIENVHVFNGWFTADSVRSSFGGIAKWLKKEKLSKLLDYYTFESKKPKRVAVIMAGNIPLVGFHDFLCIYLSGNITLAKLSSDDKHLFPALIKTIRLFDPAIDDSVIIVENQLPEFEAVIATGSNNSALHFESYFSKYPHIIRKNRNAVAILDGSESAEEIEKLGEDIFNYFGLGCRNVSQIWIPEDFELNRFFEGIFSFGSIINHNKYANNYDYNKAVYLMNQEELLDNGFLLLKEDESMASPLGVIFYRRYSDVSEFEEFHAENQHSIQVVIGKKYLPFGAAQSPELADFADGVDTLKFLEEL